MANNLASELWAGASGAAAPAQWTVTAGGSGATSSQVGDGTYAQRTGSAQTYVMAPRLVLSGMTATLDAEYVGSFLLTDAVEQYLTVNWRCTGTAATGSPVFPADGYYFTANPASGVLEVGRGAAASASKVILNGSQAFTWAGNTRYYYRVGTFGAVVYVKVWSGATEPAGWTYTGTDAAPYNTAGKFAIAYSSGGVAAVKTVSDGPVGVSSTLNGGVLPIPATPAYTPGATTTLPTGLTSTSTGHLADSNALHGAVNFLTAAQAWTKELASNATSTSTTAAAITALQWTLPVGNYTLDLYAGYGTSAAMYPRFGIGGGATLAGVFGHFETSQSATASTTGFVTGTATGTTNVHTGAATAAAATPLKAVGHVSFSVTAAGTVGIMWAASVAGTLTMLSGSYAILTKAP